MNYFYIACSERNMMQSVVTPEPAPEQTSLSSKVHVKVNDASFEMTSATVM